jgi:nucleotide-binding universal stress UspA family protein
MATGKKRKEFMMKKILVAVDFSKNTEKVVEQATALAKGLGAKAWVIHVTPDQLQVPAYTYGPMYTLPDGFVSPPLGDIEMARELCADKYKQEHHALMTLSGQMRKAGADAQAMLLKGNAAALILEQAENLDVDMIVIGSHGHGVLRKMLFGSVTEAVLRDALCNVLIVPAPLE